MITDEMITEALNNAPKNRYGQTNTIDKQPSRLFPYDTEEVINHLKTSKKYMLSTYGWTYGTYRAITIRRY